MTFARAASKCPITVILSGRLTSRPLIPAISQLPIKVAGIADCICSVSTRRYEEEPATRAQQGGKTLSMTGIGDNFRHGSTSAKTETSTIPRMGLACRVHTYSVKEFVIGIFADVSSMNCLIISRFVSYVLFFFSFLFGMLH